MANWILFLFIISLNQIKDKNIIKHQSGVSSKKQQNSAKLRKNQTKNNSKGQKEAKSIFKKPLKAETRKKHDEIVITATRSKHKLFDSNRSVNVIEQSEILNKIPRTMPESLYETPGVFVQKTNHGGGAPIIRGFVGPRILLTFSGMRLNNSLYRTGPNQYLNLQDPLFMKKVEIIKGSGSVLYGSDAIGGIIGLYPITPVFSADGSFLVSRKLLTSYETADYGKLLHGELSVSKSNLGMISAFSLRSFGDLRGGGDVGRQPYSGYDQYSVLFGSEYRFDNSLIKNGKFQLFYTANSISDAGRTDKLESKNQLQVYDNTDIIAFGRLSGKVSPINTEVEILTSFQKFFERKTNTQFNDDFSTKTSVTKNENAASTLGVELNLVTSMTKFAKLRYGGMFYKDEIASSRYEMDFNTNSWVKNPYGDYPEGATYASYGSYGVVDVLMPFSNTTNKISVFGGGRFSGIVAKVPSHESLPSVIFKDSGMVFTSGIQYLKPRKINISLVYSQGFRAPNLQESAMLGDAGNFFHVPNYSLSSETADSLELISKFRLFKYINLFASIYVMQIEGLISRRTTSWNGETQIDGKDIVESYNADKGLMYGGESGFYVDFLKNYRFKAFGYYVRGDKKDDNSDEVVPMSKIPPLTGLASIKRYFKLKSTLKGAVETYVLGATKQDRLSPTDEKDVRIPEGGTPAWWTLNVRAYLINLNTLGYGSQSRLTLSLNNLFDKKYKYHASGIYSPGFSALISLEVNY